MPLIWTWIDECPDGSDGSPCFHQYLPWSQQIATNYNFGPKCDEKARQKFAFIAIGQSLNQDFYKPFHTPLLKSLSDFLEDKKTEPESISINTLADEINENPTFEEQNAVFDEFDKAFAFLRQKVGQGNKDLDKGMITFSIRIYFLSEDEFISALHSFGGSFLSKPRRRIQV